MTNIPRDEAIKMANAIRFLSIDAIQKANSGHPGMPMGIADVATILFAEFLKFNPQDSNWLNRDRFILSAGHGSMLIYSLLYLTGYNDISLDDIKNFRQLGSKCAGHPEFGHIQGIETTTGPLGQGLGNAVGMAISEKLLKARLGKDLIDHKIYAIAGDGCLMEGISQEAISMAGHLNLNNLVILWDNNSISIDGKTNLATSENMKLRFEACGFEVMQIDGHNFDEIRAALSKAQNSSKPVMIDCKTIIGFGSPNKSNSEKAHGSPLGKEEIAIVREKLNWPYEEFEIPEDILNLWRLSAQKSSENYKNWNEQFANSNKKEFITRIQNKELSKDFDQKLANFLQEEASQKPTQASRTSSQVTLEFLTKELPELIGGSADLTGSVLTKTSSTNSISKDSFENRYIHYGIREHAMASVMNGIALHSNFIPYGGTFLVFSDYMKPAIRLSALMNQQIFYILTHDSIGLGEDGPTHQPIEHLAMLRAIPNLNLYRPADLEETIKSYESALKNSNSPSAFAFSRQNLPFIEKDQPCKTSGYIVKNSQNPQITLIATGSELHLAVEASKELQKENIENKIISIPSLDEFEKLSKSEKEILIGDKNSIKIAIEAAIEQGWRKIIGENGIFIGMNSFGASGKATDLFEHFKITSKEVIKKALEALEALKTKTNN